MRTTSAYKRLSRRNGVLLAVLAAVVLAALAPGLNPEASYAAAGKVTVVGSVAKVRPTDQPTGTSEARLTAAKNEFESFQIVVQAGSSAPLHNLKVALGKPLTGPGGKIPAANVTIYREAYYNVQQPSDQEGASGLWPDALIPTVDRFFHEPRNAFPIEVPAGENRVAWVDVLVPRGTAAGTYDGSIRVTAQGLDVTVPVHLTVRNFTLPSTSSLTSAFAMGWDDACRATYGQSCFAPGRSDEDGWRLNSLYARAALDNRITISYPQYQPLTLTSTRNRDFFRQYTLPLLKGTAPTRLPGAKLTAFQVDNNNSSFLAAWKAEAESQGFANRAFVYACDEPGADQTSWDTCKQAANAAHQVWPGVPILVTASIQNANMFNATGSINRLVVLVNEMDDKPGNPNAGNQRGNYDAFLNSNPSNQVWFYTSCMSHGCEPNPAVKEQCQSSPSSSATSDPYFNGWPGYVIDEPASEARAMGWLSFLYRTSGELYFQTTHCLQTAWMAQYAFGGNGDGTLFYPGNPNIIGGTNSVPIESTRLKLIRDGYEDYEYLNILADRGQRSQALNVVEDLFPADSANGGNMYHTSQSGARVQDARRQLAQLIQKGTGSIVPLSPAPGSSIRDRTPTVKATVKDTHSNLAKSDIRLSIDGRRQATFAYDRATDRLTYTPGSNLSLGRHTVTIASTDASGIDFSRSWSFKIVRQ
jgi:hypothetical protein